MLSSASFSSPLSTSRKHYIEFLLNGKRVILREGKFDPQMLLADYVRTDAVNLKGTKIACGEGGCGACTVITSKIDPITKKIKHKPINSCLMPLGQCHHQSITTIEYLGSIRQGINPIQKSIVEHHGTQCGFCTPGFIMNAYGLLLKNPTPTNHEIEEQFDGNLCRCTGYRGIIEAFREFSSDYKPEDNGIKASLVSSVKSIPMKEPAFADFLRKPAESVEIDTDGVKFFAPTSVEELVELKKQYPDANIVVGSSEIGIDLRTRGATKPAYISTHNIDSLYHIELKNDRLVFGASTSLQDILEYCDKVCPSLPVHKQRLLKALRERLSVFSSHQIRNTACVTGNLVHAGAVTDMSNFLLAAEGEMTVIDAKTGQTRKDTVADFFTGYRKIKLAPTDVITEWSVPLLENNEYFHVFKQAHRREDDICIVSAAMKVKINEADNTIENFKIAYSGMAAFPQNSKTTEKFLKGKKFTLDNIVKAYDCIQKDLPIAKQAPGGHAQFREELARSFLFRFFHQVEKERGRPHDESACEIIPHESPEFTVTIDNDGHECVCGHDASYKHASAEHHRAAAQQTTGEATYVDDMLMPANGVYGYPIFSQVACGKIVKADYSKCLEYPGVVDVVTYKDIPGKNCVGDVWRDETVFAENEVKFVGQMIALVCADTPQAARRAAQLAKIEIKEEKGIYNIEQAIKANSFYKINHHIKRGDADKEFDKCEHVVEGEFRIGTQSHFYLEPHTSLAVPGEDNKMQIYSSTQNPTFAQECVAEILGVSMSNVDVHAKRLGGGFGGKETRSIMISNPAAVAAHKLNRAVKITLDRQDDMPFMGTRHPFIIKYKAGITKDGYIHALKEHMYADCGWCLDLSLAITDRALLHADGAYYIPHFFAESHLCRTNQRSTTAYRGFGAPQGFHCIETIIDHICTTLKLDPHEFRRRNLYRESQTTPAGVVLRDCNALKAWDHVNKNFDYYKIRKECEEFNKVNKYKKRGVAITPLKFGIAFTFGILNQAGCLVNIYRDGSVLVTHGGVEMGQGLHTKMCQVAARTLNIPVEYVRIDETSTDKVPNTSATAASTGADLNGHAIYNACMQLNARMNKYRKPGKKWADICHEAWADKCDLSAHGYFGNTEVGFDWERGVGNPFHYYVYGAAASIAEIDTLTGDHQILRTDLVYDVGDSINPAIDIGQVEGAYLQGYGYLTMEEWVVGDGENDTWLQPGRVHTVGPGRYKIPGYNDLPKTFKVGLLPNSRNSCGVYSSKAIGEPPLLMANAAAFAIVDAVHAARRDAGVQEHFPIVFPMTSDRIRTLCQTKIGK